VPKNQTATEGQRALNAKIFSVCTIKKQVYLSMINMEQFSRMDTDSLKRYAVTGKCKGKKGKAIPIHAWAGPEGSRRLRLPDFKTISARRW